MVCNTRKNRRRGFTLMEVLIVLAILVMLVGMVALAPIAMYSISKLLWLAFDLMLRPVTPDELEWHRTAASEFSTGHSSGRQEDGR